MLLQKHGNVTFKPQITYNIKMILCLTFAGLSADLLPEEDGGWIHSDRTERV